MVVKMHNELAVNQKVETGTPILACVAIQGAKRGTGWRYTWYYADHKLKSGYRYSHARSMGMYPNRANDAYSATLEAACKRDGVVVVHGRPNQRVNAPKVVKQS